MTEKNVGAIHESPVQAFIDDATAIARDAEAAPEAVAQRTAELIETNFPRPFKDGEVILMHEFERRFRKAFCKGIEPHYARWAVRVDVDGKGNITLRLGKTLEQMKADLATGAKEI